MAENKNYSNYYTPLEIGNNDLDWSLLNKHRSGVGFSWQIIARNIDGGYLSKASSGPRSVNGETRDVRDWSTAFTYEETRDPQFLAKFIKSSGILSEENLAELGEDWDGFFDGTLPLEKYHAIIGAYAIGTTNSKTSYATDKINKNLGKVTPAKEYVTQLDTLTRNLESYGANPAEIQTYLENKTWADAADVSSTINNLADTWEQSGQDTQQFQVLLTQAQNDSQDSDSKELGNILLTQQPSNDDNTTGATEGNATEGNATEGGITPTDQTTVSVATADDRQTTLNTAVDNTFLGQSTLEALRNYADETDNISYRFDEETGQHFLDTTDEDGNVTNSQEFAVDNNNNQVIYVGGEKDGQRFSQGGVIEDIESSKAVEDQAFQDQQALVDELGGLRDEYGDFLTSYTGGEVTPAVAQQLGWTNNGDGTYTDPSDPSKTYTLNEETGTLESDGVAATTEGLNTQNDFASQINAQLNEFLNGPKDADGNPVTDENGNPIKGFLDTQADLEQAATDYQSESQAVSGYRDADGNWVDGEYDTQLDTLKGTLQEYQDASGDINGYYDPETGEWVEGTIDELFNQVTDLNDTYQKGSQAINGYYDPETGEWVEGQIDQLFNQVNTLNENFQEASGQINGYYDPETGEWVEGQIDKLFNQVNALNQTYQESNQQINGYYDPETGEWVEGQIDQLFNQVNDLNKNYLQGSQAINGYYDPETGEWVEGQIDQLYSKLDDLNKSYQEGSRAINGFYDPETGEWTPGQIDQAYERLAQITKDYQAGQSAIAGRYNPETGEFEGGLYAKAYEDLAGKTQSYQDDLRLLSGYRNEAGEWVPGEYDKAYQGYADDLEPLTTEARRVRNQLGDIGDMSLRVANDANNPNYYSRLQDLYYQDAKDTIDRTTSGARDSLNQQYAQAGLDPSSPAYTAAMMDLQNSRSDALRSSRRQAILDSYGLGSQMLGNRSSTLNNAANMRMGEMTGLNNEMNALDSLYGVKLEGLNSRRDMIGQIYNTDRDLANQQFNMLDQQMNALNQGYNTNLNLVNQEFDLYNTRNNALSNDYNTGLSGLYAQLDQQNNRNAALTNNYNTALTGLNTQLDQQNNRNLANANNYNTALTGLNTQLDQQNTRNTALTNNYNTALTGLNTQLDQQNNRNTALTNNYNTSLTGLNTQFDQQNNRNTALTNRLNTDMDLINLELDRLNNRSKVAGQNWDTAKTLAEIRNTGLDTKLQTLLAGIQANQSQFQNDRQFGLDALNQRLKLLGLEYDAQGNIRQTADTQGTNASDSLVDLYTGGKSDALTYATLEDLAKQRGEELQPWIKEVFGR